MYSRRFLQQVTMKTVVESLFFLILFYISGLFAADEYGNIRSPVDFSKANINESVVSFIHYKINQTTKVYPVGTKGIEFGPRAYKIIIHGHGGNPREDWLLRVKDRMVVRLYNVLVVDWSKVAYNYEIAAANTQKLGEYVGRFIIDNNFILDRTHVIGAGLGGHAAGQAGKYVARNVTGKQVNHITVLDLSGPKFEGNNIPATNKFQRTDAVRTECIHTNARKWGYKAPVARIDWYPNGGNVQPGCRGYRDDQDLCSHSRSYWLFLESIDYLQISIKTDVAVENGLVNLTNPDPLTYLIFGQWCGSVANGTYTFNTNIRPTYLKYYYSFMDGSFVRWLY